ncbi:MAG: polysaccharide biosynthesis/export family protein [Chitinophagales bacterium]|jgi:polysaccharide export outer membrane protein|nr:polysaccharide biosynthesis/export family protein [Chitinophagales bacterium]
MKSYYIIPYLLLLIGIISINSSCKAVKSHYIFQDIDKFAVQSKIDSYDLNHRIQVNDEISLKILGNHGMEIIESSAETAQPIGAANTPMHRLLVLADSTLLLPQIGRFKVVGMTEVELRNKIKELYGALYVNPYIYVRIENKRVFVFKGSLAQVVELRNPTTNIIEVLAMSGGLDRFLKSDEVYVLRGNLNTPNVTHINLQKIAEMKQNDLYIQSNDIIMVNERPRPLFNALNEIAPIVTMPLALITSLLSTVFLIITLNRQ